MWNARSILRAKTRNGNAASWREIGDCRVDVDGIAQTETDHFGNCQLCGALVGTCDLAHVGEKAPAIGDGCQSREETVRNVLGSREQLCVVIHTRVGKERT